MNDPTRMEPRKLNTETPTLRRGRWFAGLLIIATGALLAILGGACTVQTIGDMLIPHSPPEGQSRGRALEVVLGLVFGGGPTVIGLALIFIGWRSIRRPPQKPKADA